MRKTIWLVLVAALVDRLWSRSWPPAAADETTTTTRRAAPDHRRWHGDHRGSDHDGWRHRDDCGCR